jgi:outer membrane receptor protein involved in Fe transport
LAELTANPPFNASVEKALSSKQGEGFMRLFTTTATVALLSTMAGLGASTAHAQDASKDEVLEEVVVTGSRIARRDYVSDSPITTVDQSAIAATGSPTLETSLNQLPQLAFSASSNTNTSARGGQANINLRGLGPQRGLVLIDGRRVQPSSPEGSIDLNTIPSSLVDNVEIITGGASAVYGSDAVAGVANLKLRRNVEGVEVNAQYGRTGHDDGATKDLGLLVGGKFADGKGRAMVSLSYAERDRARYQDRDYLRYQILVPSLTTFTVGVAASNLPSQAAVNSVFAGYGVPAGQVSRNSQFLVNTDGTLFTTRGPTNFRGQVTSPLTISNDTLYLAVSELYSAQTPLKRYNLFGHVEYEVTPDVNLFVEGIFTNYKTETGALWANSGSSSGKPLFVPVTNPFIPADLAQILSSRPNPTAPFTISGFIDDNVPRREVDEYNVYQLSAGLSGRVEAIDASWNVYGTFGKTDYVATQYGYPSSSAINTLLAAPDGGRSVCPGGFNPFGFAPIDQGCVDFIARIAKNHTNLTQGAVEATLTGSLADLPAGPLQYAVGADYRENSYDFSPDALISQGDLANYLPVAGSSGTAKVYEAFGELQVPLLRDAPLAHELSVNLGFRYSDYNTVGGVTTYRVEGAWSPIEAIRVRGGYARAIRAPSVGELFSADAQGQTPLGAPGVLGSGDPCDVRGAYRAAGAADAGRVRALCLAQGVPANLVDSFTNVNPRTPFLSRGNRELDPETADTYSLGVVLRPRFDQPLLSRLSVSVDYYNIALKDAIGLITNPVAAAQCFNPAINPSYDPSNYYCQLLQRDPANGQLAQIVNPQLNLASYKTSGVDFQVDWKVDLEALGADPKWGTLSLGVVASYLATYKIQNLAGAPVNDYAGTIGNVQIDPFAAAHPTWKATTTLGWDVWRVRTNLRWRYLDAMSNASNVGTTGTAKGVGEISYFDLDALWRVDDDLELRAGIVNLADKRPPTLNVSYIGLQATDPYTYDLLGRRFFVALKAKF